MADNLVVVAEYGTAIEGNLACNRLVSAGIQAVLQNEGIQADLGFGTALGSVQLLVHEADAQKSLDLLEEHVSEQEVDEAVRDSANVSEASDPELLDDEEE